MAYAPPVLYTATQTHTPPTRTSPGRGRGACLSVWQTYRAPLPSPLPGRRAPSGLSWVFLSLAPMGAGANHPPLTGGQLTFGVLVGVLVGVLPPAARVHSRILGRNLEFGSFLKSHFLAGYVCFVLLRECISISVTYGDSCNR